MAALWMPWIALTLLSFALMSLVNGRCYHDWECYNGGRCDPEGLCVCAEGFTGSSCRKSDCVPSCKNGGACVASSVCVCKRQYYGSSCQNSRSSDYAFFGSNAKYVSGAVFGGGLLLCTCIGILVFWLYVRRRRQSSGRRMYSTARRRRRRSITGQTAQTERRISASAASGRRLFVAPQPSPLADPNAPPPYAPSAGPPSSDPPPYTAQTAANSPQPFPQALEVPRPLSYSDEPPAYLSPPAYDPECDNHQ